LWDRIDPTTLNRQGNDAGTQYRSGIYYHTNKQKEIAYESLKQEQLKYNAPIVTEILEAVEFFPAEEYHQRYLEKGGQCAAKGDSTNIRCYG
jgi:methionine-S-sulfoxide reductase